MKLFYFQARKELNSQKKLIDLLKQANAALAEDLKIANDKLEKRKKKKEQNEEKGNGNINTIL